MQTRLPYDLAPSRKQPLTLSAAIGLFTSIEAYAQTGAACDAWKHGEFFKAATVADVERCLKTGADPNDGAHLGRTPLHTAAIFTDNPAVIAVCQRRSENARE